MDLDNKTNKEIIDEILKVWELEKNNRYNAKIETNNSENVEKLEEVKVLEEKVSQLKKNNRKKKVIKNLKIAAKFCWGKVPYVLCFGGFIGSMKLSGIGFPFCPESSDVSISDMKDMYNPDMDNIIYLHQYDEHSESKNLLYYYKNIGITKSGLYKRHVQIYNIGELTAEKLFSLNNDSSLSEIFGEPIREYNEKKENLINDEKENEEYFKVIFYDSNKDGYSVVRGPMASNVGFSILYLLQAICISISLYIGKRTLCYENNISPFKNYVKDVSRNYNHYKLSVQYEKQKLEKEIEEIKRKTKKL